MPDRETPGIGLAAAIAKIRSELELAEKEGKGSSIAFRTQQVELDLEVAFEDQRSGTGGLQIYVLSLGGKRQTTRENAQRLKLRLTPVDPTTGQQKQVSRTGKK